MRLRLEGKSLSFSPRQATRGRARALPSPGEAPSTRGVKCSPGGCGGRRVPSVPRASSRRPTGLPARAAGTSSPQRPGGYPSARPEGGEPGDSRSEGRGEESGETPWGREGQAPLVDPGRRGGVPGAGARAFSRRRLSDPPGGRSRPASPGVERGPAPSRPILPPRWGSAVRLRAGCGGRTARRASEGAGAPRAPPRAPGPLAEAAPSGAL